MTNDSWQARALMRYEGKIFRPPSEASSYILQATIGCSWNHCTYCDMYRDKEFRVRDLSATLQDIEDARRLHGPAVDKVFVADGDALVMDMDTWRPILQACRRSFPRLRRVSAYATAKNVLDKDLEELVALRDLGLELLYIGPESGDDVTLKRIAKGATFDEHARAAERARAAGIDLSVIFLLGVGGVDRSAKHARASAELITAMDPQFVSALTLTIVPKTPLATLSSRNRFSLPAIDELLGELRTMVADAAPTDALFRTNHASNYLPLGGRLPRDRDAIVGAIDAALAGKVPLRPEWSRGL